MGEPTKNPEDAQVLDTTTVGQVDVNIDELFGSPGAENIMLPAEGEEDNKPKSLFSNQNIDVSFLDKPGTTAESKAEKADIKADVDEAIA
jgi:hypothetical protein